MRNDDNTDTQANVQSTETTEGTTSVKRTKRAKAAPKRAKAKKAKAAPKRAKAAKKTARKAAGKKANGIVAEFNLHPEGFRAELLKAMGTGKMHTAASLAKHCDDDTKKLNATMRRFAAKVAKYRLPYKVVSEDGKHGIMPK